jgi:MerR family transcriptional regulator, Zn(II)-responsive regulator of zntA
MGYQNGTQRDKGVMTIGDLARRAGTTMRTIRYYEERGLIEPIGRTKGGFRLYEEEELRKLHLIRSLQELDMPLAQVKAFFDERQRGRTGAEIAPALRTVLQEHLQVMRQRIAQYQAMQDSIRETMEILKTCEQCPHEPGPSICPVCPALAGRVMVPLHMQAVIEAAGRSADTNETTAGAPPQGSARVSREGGAFLAPEPSQEG